MQVLDPAPVNEPAPHALDPQNGTQEHRLMGWRRPQGAQYSGATRTATSVSGMLSTLPSFIDKGILVTGRAESTSVGNVVNGSPVSARRSPCCRPSVVG